MSGGGAAMAMKKGMVVRVGSVASIALMVGLLAVPSVVRAESCRDLVGAFQQASKEGKLDAVKTAHDAVFEAPDCPDRTRAQVSGVAALVYVKTAMRRLESGETLDSQEPLLTQALGLGRPWQALALMADLNGDRKDYGKASALYQEALSVIKDENRTPSAPPVAEIEKLFRRANEMQLLAADYVPAPRDRAGEPDGLAAPQIRGFQIESIPMPITFAYDKTEFTDKGRQAVADLAEWLRAQKPAAITIIGHTDARGSDEYNMTLSRRRAETVADVLRASGYSGAISALGMGKRSPFRPDNPDRYSAEERFQLDRRVEFRR